MHEQEALRIHSMRRKILRGLLIGLIILVSLGVLVRVRRAIALRADERKLGYAVHTVADRTYLVHLPASFDGTTPLPVVLNFHGGGGDAQGQIIQSQMNATADRENFIAVYPQGVGHTVLGHLFGTWNAGETCCGPAMKQNSDDVGFVRNLLDDLAATFPIDAKRVYATGLSNGSMMSFRLACDLADRIAAIAALNGPGVQETCKPSRPIPVLYFAGLADPCVPLEGGQRPGCLNSLLGVEVDSDRSMVAPVAEYMTMWRTLNGCSDTPRTVLTKGQVTCTLSDRCRDGSAVQYCTVGDGGHTWPGGTYGTPCADSLKDKICTRYQRTVGHLNTDISANDVMWEFFEKHPMP